MDGAEDIAEDKDRAPSEQSESSDEESEAPAKGKAKDKEESPNDKSFSSDSDSDIQIKKKAKGKLQSSSESSDSSDEESEVEINKKTDDKVESSSKQGGSSDSDSDIQIGKKTKDKNDSSSEESESSDDESDIQIEKKTKNKEGSPSEQSETSDEESDTQAENETSKAKPVLDSSDEESDLEGSKKAQASNGMIYDFDVMMAKKKEENSRKRRRRGYDIINDNDDIIADIINQMKDAVESDIEANKNKQVATNKLKLLPFLINQLRKVDLRDAFLDSDVLSVIAEWLAPLPDRSLPHLNIRENLLKILIDFNLYDVDRIKGSGIGKAVMYLYKHPKETKENKERAKQLISAWSRPIFNLDSSFSAISREERQERDRELQRRASRTMVDSSDGEGGPSSARKRPKDDAAQPVAKNPGDKGWIPRARVPAPSMRDYVVRPRSKVDGDIGKVNKRPANMLEKLMRTHQERRRANKQQRAVNMKIDKC